MDCPVCAHPDHTTIENEIMALKISKRDAAEIIGCRVDEVYTHMTEHLIKQKLTTTDSKRNVLLSSMQKCQTALETIAAGGQHGPVTTKQLTDLSREIRQTVMSLRDLESGGQSTQHITIEQYNDFRSLIVTKILLHPEMCDKCKTIVTKALEEEDKNDRPIIEIEDGDKGV